MHHSGHRKHNNADYEHEYDYDYVNDAEDRHAARSQPAKNAYDAVVEAGAGGGGLSSAAGGHGNEKNVINGATMGALGSSGGSLGSSQRSARRRVELRTPAEEEAVLKASFRWLYGKDRGLDGD